MQRARAESLGVSAQYNDNAVDTIVSNCVTSYGPSDRIRTCGLMVPNHPRYQLRYTRIKSRRRRGGFYTISFSAGAVNQFSRFLPQKNSATVPGPVWAPMVVPMELMSTFPSSLGNRSSTNRATSRASSRQAELEI